MSSKLSKQLQRELKANPQKAGMLGLLVLVAAWFWGPLIFKSDDTKRTTPIGAPVATATMPAVGSTIETPVAAAGKPRTHWRTLSSRLQSDPMMRSVSGKKPEDAGRSPFDAAVLKVKQEPLDDELLALLEEAETAGLLDDEKPVITKQMTSTALNAYPLRLSSTLVGSRSRTAIINGRAFPQGTSIGRINNVELVLEYVDPRSAVIAWNGARRELRIPKPGEQPSGPQPDQSDLNSNDADDTNNADEARSSASDSDEARASNTETSAEVGDVLLKWQKEAEATTN